MNGVWRSQSVQVSTSRPWSVLASLVQLNFVCTHSTPQTMVYDRQAETAAPHACLVVGDRRLAVRA